MTQRRNQAYPAKPAPRCARARGRFPAGTGESDEAGPRGPADGGLPSSAGA
jgi:hypothetical protein